MSVSQAVNSPRVWFGGRRRTLLEAIGALGGALPTTPDVDPAWAARKLDRALADGSDELAVIAAVHALAAAPGGGSSERLGKLLRDDTPFLQEHAAWSLGSSPLVESALPGLVDLVVAGGFAGTLAQATVESFAAQDLRPVRDVLVGALTSMRPEGPRMRLVETLGLLPGSATTRILLGLAADDREPPAARAAALAALGDNGDPFDAEVAATLDAVARTDGDLTGVARLACGDLDHRRAPAVGRAHGEGLTVAQLLLHADIDGSLLRAGQGDTGGIATLLVHLGDALLANPSAVRRVVTISRGRAGDDPSLESVNRPGHHYLPVPFWGPPVPAAEAWPLRVATRRAMRRILSRAHVDVLHLRMADVGSWAGAEAARDLGIPVVMTLAPDPHASVALREADGSLNHANFGRADQTSTSSSGSACCARSSSRRPSWWCSLVRTSRLTCATCSGSTSCGNAAGSPWCLRGSTPCRSTARAAR